MKYILFFCFVFLSSCTSVKPVVCSIETTAVSVVSSSISGALACTNIDVIKADLTKAFDKSNLCTAAPAPIANGVKVQGVVGNIVCPLAVGAAMSLIGISIPPAWGCDPKSSLSGLATVVTAACVAAMPI